MTIASTTPALPLHEHCLRQVHLDFHTSPYLPDVGSEFDADAFARQVKAAHIDSITVFAKCCHGMSYYPTKVGTIHPSLNDRDLLGEQIEALHRHGIRCPIYTSVGWDEDAARRFPQWSQMNEQGFMLPAPTATDGNDYVGGWKYLDFLNPDYQDYIEAHVRELFANYEVDGMFYDILFYHRNGWWSPAALDFRKKNGLLKDDKATWSRFESAAQIAFMQRFTALGKSLRPDATVFYNAHNDGFVNADTGPRARSRLQTHQEIESLPSGSWGYYHFPRMARMQSYWGKPWVGMTGRFQKAWGDFGGIKPQAALEFECFRSQALGGGNFVGDQLPPRGTADPSAYALIGSVYAQVAAAEPFYAGSQSLPQLAVYCAGYPGIDGGKSEEGAVQMAEETHYDAMVCDELSDLSAVRLAVLPDSVVITPRLKETLAAFYRAGGSLILSYRSGFDAEGNWALDFLPLEFADKAEIYPTYWRATEPLQGAIGTSDRVVYAQGMNVTGGAGTRVWAQRVLPYFKRNALTFCSHMHAPPQKDADAFAAVIGGERFVYFADPIFAEYRDSGNCMVRDGWLHAVRSLIGHATFGEGLPKTVQACPRRRGNDLLLTLLHYVAVRKALAIDIIEEPATFAGEVLRLPASVKRVRQVIAGGLCGAASGSARAVADAEAPLAFAELKGLGGGAFELPPVKGRILLEVPDFFV